MKILIITPRIPYPPYRGDKLKIYNIARILARSHKVTIATFYSNKKEPGYIEELKKINVTVEAVKLSQITSLANAAGAFFTDRPFQVAYYSSAKMNEKLKQIISEGDFDAVYFHLVRSAQYIDALENSKSLKVIDFTDAVSLYLSRYAEVEKNIFKKLLIKSEFKRINSYESIARGFDTLFVCSEIDKKFLQQRDVNKNIRILSNGIDTGYFVQRDSEIEKHRIIFTGNMPYFPNHDAAYYFAKEIFPSVSEKFPDSRFYIVGQKPPSKIKKLASEKIIVTGFVDDIRSEYLKSEINVAPIRFGAGTLNKVLESLILGVPVVASAMSVMGLPEEIRKYVFIADTPEKYTEQISYIFNNPSVRTDFMKEAREKLCSILGWEEIVRDFEEYLSLRVGQAKS